MPTPTPSVPIIDFTKEIPKIAVLLKDIKANWHSWISDIQKQAIVFGFDGFIDDIMSVVEVRRSLTDVDTVKTMAEWAQKVQKTAGSSIGFETVPKERRTGGFVSNTAQALASIITPIMDFTLIGNFGYPTPLPIFTEHFKTNLACNLISLGEPGTTLALEFNDGKVMLTNFRPIHEITMDLILKHFNKDELILLLDSASLFGLGYWSITPEASAIFRYLSKNIFPALTHPLEVFLDLADIRKRSKEDIQDLLTIINAFPITIRTTLSLNDREAVSLIRALDLSSKITADIDTISSKEDYLQILQILRQQLPITRLIIHTPNIALIAVEEMIVIMPNAFTSTPKFTVAAGDTFNAGVCLGILTGCSVEEILLLGNILTSYFIRTGIRGNFGQIEAFSTNFINYLTQDLPDISSILEE